MISLLVVMLLLQVNESTAYGQNKPTPAEQRADIKSYVEECTPWRSLTDRILAAKKCDIFGLFPELSRKHSTPLQKKVFLASKEAKKYKQQCRRMFLSMIHKKYCMKLGDLSEYNLKKKSFLVEFDNKTNSIKRPAPKGFQGVWFSKLKIVQKSEYYNPVRRKIMHVKYLRLKVPENEAVRIERGRSRLAAWVFFTLSPTVKKYTEVSFSGSRYLSGFIVASKARVFIGHKDSIKVTWPIYLTAKHQQIYCIGTNESNVKWEKRATGVIAVLNGIYSKKMKPGAFLKHLPRRGTIIRYGKKVSSAIAKNNAKKNLFEFLDEEYSGANKAMGVYDREVDFCISATGKKTVTLTIRTSEGSVYLTFKLLRKKVVLADISSQTYSAH